MIRSDVIAPTRGMIDTYRRYAIQTFERAGVRTVGVAARRGKSVIRQGMAGAGLGRLGNAIDANADDAVYRMGGDRFSVSARFFVRSRSERTLGAIAAYTEGADISPVRSRWLWIPTDDIPRVTKRFRLTPAMWRGNGFDKKIGSLIQIKSVNGYPLLAVESVGVNALGGKRSAKSLTKSGRPRKGHVRRELVVAFVGIPRTSRMARVNVTEILNTIRADLPAIFATELSKERR